MKKIPARLHLPVLLAMFLVFSLSSESGTSAQMHGGAMGERRGDVSSNTRLSVFETADFSGSGICAFCHDALRDSEGNDVSIISQWRSAMMANSSKDPLWRAKVSSEVKRTPSLASNIEEKCSRCHMGMARYQAITDGSPVAALGSGFLDPDHPLYEAAMDGVSCTLCHQIKNMGPGARDYFTGQYVIETSTFSPYRLIFGPYDQPFERPMMMHTGFSPTRGGHISESALCGTCHTLYTPSIDAKKSLTGEFAEQTTYLEWEHSASGGGIGKVRTCQNCHTPAASGPVAISNRPPWISPRSPFGLHLFVGGNSYMLTMLKTHAASLGVTAESVHFDATISRTNAQLESKTAALTVLSAARSDSALTFVLKIENKAGHKFPSGIPARRSWLHVVVSSSEGVVFESGKPLPDGSIAGNRADEDGEAFEPHRDLISHSDQVQIYETIMMDSEGKVTYTLLRALSYAKDNRLLPTGFNKASAPSDIAVVGEAATDSNFASGEDTVTYRVPLPDGPLTITAELLYQSVSCSFVKDLRQDETDFVNRFIGLHDSSDKYPKLIAKIQKSVQ